MVSVSIATDEKGKAMATRGIVAHSTRNGNGWRGRYVHWDNYPERMVGVLGELVARDGTSSVAHTLCYDHASWSIIDTLAKPSEAGEPSLYEANACVTGYGYAHTDTSLDDPSAWFTDEDTELAWCEWLYIIHADRLEVRRITKDENGNDVAIFDKAHPWESIAIQEATA